MLPGTIQVGNRLINQNPTNSEDTKLNIDGRYLVPGLRPPEEMSLHTNPFIPAYPALLASPTANAVAFQHQLYALHLAKLADCFLNNTSAQVLANSLPIPPPPPLSSNNFGIERRVEEDRIKRIIQNSPTSSLGVTDHENGSASIRKSESPKNIRISNSWKDNKQKTENVHLKFGVHRILSISPSSSSPEALSKLAQFPKPPLSYNPELHSYPISHQTQPSSQSQWTSSWFPVSNHIYGPIIGGHLHSVPGSSPNRRGMLRRAVFSARQRELLEKKFQQLKYIGKSERQKLATALGLKDSQVKIWFQNRRMKWRSSLESKQHQSSTNNIPISSSQSSSVFVPMKKEKVKVSERLETDETDFS